MPFIRARVFDDFITGIEVVTINSALLKLGVMFTLIMNKKRITTLIIISFISGAILGGAGVFVYLGNTVSDSIAILSLQNRAEWEIRASNAYKNGSSEVGIWALTNLSEILKEDA